MLIVPERSRISATTEHLLKDTAVQIWIDNSWHILDVFHLCIVVTC